MVVVLQPGVDRNDALSHLRDLHVEINNQHTGGAWEIGTRLFDYLNWAGKAAQVLAGVINSADVDRLVLTRRYQMLIDAASGLLPLAGRNPAEKVLSDLVALEVSERARELGREIAALEEQIARWGRNRRYAVLDTNVYLEHRDRLEQVNFAAILAALEAPIHVLVPMVVLDELDSAKRLNDHRRGRATIALATINRVVRDGGVLRERDPTAVTAGGSVPVPNTVTLEVLSEPSEHRRLPNNDAEIVDRTLAVQAAVGVPVALVTFDTGMGLRAREAGLEDRLLSEDDRAVDQRRAKKTNGTTA